MLDVTDKPLVDVGLADRPARKRNDALRGLACLRCGAQYPLHLVHSGCPACAQQGVHVSLAANYERSPGEATYLPYAQPFSLGEGRTPLT